MATFLHLTSARRRAPAPVGAPPRVTNEEDAVADPMALVPDDYEVVVAGGTRDAVAQWTGDVGQLAESLSAA